MNGPDVVVIGGGPAGLAAAIVCATHGQRTLLVERRSLPVDKACGEGVLPNGVAALERIGIDRKRIIADARVIPGIRYFSPRGRTAAASFGDHPALGVRRVDLSRLLSAHARTRSGLEIITGQAAQTAVDESGRPVVRVGGTTVRPKLIIGADGLHSRTRSSLGITARPGRRTRWGCRQHFDGEPWTRSIEVYFGHGFDFYVTPVTRGVNVAVLWDARAVTMPEGPSPVTALIAKVPALAHRLASLRPADRARAGGPFDVRVRRPWRAGALLLGDAAGYLDPLTGEGVGLALEQAALLRHTVIPALGRTPHGAVVASAALAQFTRAIRTQSRPNRRLTRLLLRAARHPALLERIVAALGSHPALFAHLVEVNMGRRNLWSVPMPARERRVETGIASSVAR
jgi:flavin-dependent dehydrogenase